MRMINIDWTSDAAIFLVTMFALVVVTIVMLEKLFPKARGKNRRSVETSNDIID